MSPPNYPLPTDTIKIQNSDLDEYFVKRFSCYVHLYADRRILDRFSFKFEGTTIIVFDLFTGNVKKFTPKTPFNAAKLSAYVPLSATQSFLSYSTTFWNHDIGSSYATIVSIDLQNNNYTFKINPIEFADSSICREFYSAKHQQLGLKIYIRSQKRSELHVFKADKTLLTVPPTRIVKLPRSYAYFNLLENNQIVFVNMHGASYVKTYSIFIDGFTLINVDGSLNKLADTAVCLDSRIDFEVKRNETLQVSAQSGCWHHEHFFYFFNLEHHIYKSRQFECRWPEYRYSIPCGFVFNLQTREWSQIRFNYPPNKHWYIFDVDSHGVLNVLGYVISESSIVNDHLMCNYEATLSRLPIKKPDTLFNLAFFRARSMKIIDKLQFLKC